MLHHTTIKDYIKHLAAIINGYRFIYRVEHVGVIIHKCERLTHYSIKQLEKGKKLGNLRG